MSSKPQHRSPPPTRHGSRAGAGRSGSHGIARVLSKLGFCSRSEAIRLVEAGRVQINGHVCRNPEQRTHPDLDQVLVDGRKVQAEKRVYLMLNKPRGLVTTTRDEKGRPTVFQCLTGWGESPRVFPVGRLDQASEGLLLFTNDTAWAALLTSPEAEVEKTYHLQVARVVEASDLDTWRSGITSEGEILRVARAGILRRGERNTWLEVVLTEGRNRQLRRMCEASGWEVLRLVRVRIGPWELGDLKKGAFRHLSAEEVSAVRPM